MAIMGTLIMENTLYLTSCTRGMTTTNGLPVFYAVTESHSNLHFIDIYKFTSMVRFLPSTDNGDRDL